MRFMYSSWYLAALSSFFTLKSSNWAKAFFLARIFSRAGGYWPEQYHEPGASQILLAGLLEYSFDVFDTPTTS